MNSNNKIYNQRTAEGILQKALELKDKSIKDLYPEVAVQYKGKGRLGQLVEKLHFGYDPNSNQVADFYDAGVELKTSPIKQLSNGNFVSKERLSLTHIDFNKLVEESKFEESTLIKKIDVLLLMFYLYQQGFADIEYVFKIIKLWKIPEKDFHIIEQDWNKIVNTIRKGNAHLISGGDTYYLEASTTGQGKGRDLVSQPFSEIQAKKRRFAFKSKYVNLMIADELQEMESLLPKDFDFNNSSIETYIVSKFKEYYGCSESELKKKFKLQYQEGSKHSANLIARAILGLSLDSKIPIEEFEKANIKIKTIVLEENGVLKESMSFQQIDYDEVAEEEDFTESFLYKEIVALKYLFVIFRKDSSGEKCLEKAVLWNMDAEAESIAEEFWIDIKAKIQEGDYDNFWKSSDKKIFHVRPKARNSKDLKQLSNGRMVKKYAYWLNRNYILEKVIAENIEV